MWNKELARKRYWANVEVKRQQHREYYARNKERVRDQRMVVRNQLRAAVLEKFGNRCATCGFNDIRALQLDHINGGGGKENQLIGNVAVYRKALRGDSGYQVLCANCNWIKRYE